MAKLRISGGKLKRIERELNPALTIMRESKSFLTRSLEIRRLEGFGKVPVTSLLLPHLPISLPFLHSSSTSISTWKGTKVPSATADQKKKNTLVSVYTFLIFEKIRIFQFDSYCDKRVSDEKTGQCEIFNQVLSSASIAYENACNVLLWIWFVCQWQMFSSL